MKDQEPTGLVTITSVPQGGAPEEVRRAWVGLTLPCFSIAGVAGLVMSVATGDVRRDKRLVVIVPQKEALDLLKKSNASAAQWWFDHGFPMATEPYFSFGWDEVSVVSGVEIEKTIVVYDEDMGDPFR